MKKANKKLVEGFITKLSRCEIFVFGSNLEGQHLGGAARKAAMYTARTGRFKLINV